MSTENIGGVGISVDIDLSGLEQKFQEAVAEAATDGQKIGQAIAEGISSGAESGAAAFDAAMQRLVAGGATANEAFQQLTGSTQTFMQALQSGELSQFADNFGKITESAQPVATALDAAAESAGKMAQQLSLFGDIGTPFADASGQLNMFSGAIEIVANDSKSLSSALGSIGEDAAKLGAGFDGATNSEKAFSEGAQSVISAQSQADSELKAAQSVLAELQSAYERGAVSENDLARAAQQLQQAFNNANPAIEESGKAANVASAAWGAFTGVLAAFGVQLSLSSFVHLSEDILATADAFTKASISLTALTGDADAAGVELERLEQLGISDGLKMPALLQAAQAMTNLLPAGADVVGVLSQVADASVVSGKSIEGIALSIDRMVNTTSLNARSLAQIGLNLASLGDAMDKAGVGARAMGETVQQAFSALDPHDKLVVIQTALEKFKDVAEDVANNTFGGVWHQAMAQWDTDIGIIQKDLGELAGKAIGSTLKDSVNFIAEMFVVMGTAVVVAIDSIKGSIKELEIELTALGQASAMALQGNLTGAAAAISTAFVAVQSVEKETQDKINADMTAGSKILQDIMFQTHSSVTPVIEKLDHLGVSAKGAGESAKQAAEDIIKLAQATHELRDFTQAALDPMQVLGAAADVDQAKFELMATQLGHLNANMLAADAALKDAALQYAAGQIGLGEYERALQNFITAADKAAQKQRELNAALSSAETATALAAMVKNLNDAKQASTDAGTAIGQLGILAGQAAPAMSPLNQAMIDAGVNAAKAKNAFQDLHTPIQQIVDDMGRLADAARSSGDWSVVTTAIENFDRRIQELSKTDLPEADRQMQAFVQGLINAKVPAELVQGQLDKLGQIVQKMSKEDLPGAKQAWADYLSLLNQVPHTYGQILEVQAAQLQSQIKLDESSGKSVENQLLGLEKIKLAQEQLRIETHGAADAIIAAINDINKGFDQMGSTMADAIVNGKNVGDALVGQFKKIATSVLGDLIQGALTPLKGELIGLEKSLLPGVSGALNQTGGAVAGLASNAGACSTTLTGLTGASTAASGAHTVMAATATTASASLAAMGVSAQLAAIQMTLSAIQLNTLIGAIAGIVGAIAGIIGDVYLAAIDTKLFHVETSLIEIRNEVENTRADLWHQHDDYLSKYDMIYARLGDMWTTLQELGGASGGSALNDTQSGDLHLIATNSTGILSDLQDIDIRVTAANGWFQTIDSTVSGGLSTINSTLFIIIARLDSVISAINYHGLHNDNSQDQQVTEMRTMNAKASDGPRNIVSAINGAATHNNELIAGIQGGVNHIGQSVDQQIAQGERQLGAANAQLAAAISIADQVVALQNIIHADYELRDAAIRAGNLDLAAQYDRSAQQVTAELVRLEGIGSAGVTSIDSYIAAGASTIAFSQTTGSGQISDRVTGAQTAIVNAVQSSAIVISAGMSSIGPSIAGSLSGLISLLGAWGAAGGGLPGGKSGQPSGSGGSTTPSGPYDPGMYNPPPTGGGVGFTPTGAYKPPGPTPPPGGQSQGPGYGGVPGAYAPGPGALPYIPGGPVPSPESTQTLTGAPVGGTTPVGGNATAEGIANAISGGPSAKAPSSSIRDSDITKPLADIAADTAKQADLAAAAAADGHLAMLRDQVSSQKQQIELAIANHAPPAMMKLLQDQLAGYEKSLGDYEASMGYLQDIYTSSQGQTTISSEISGTLKSIANSAPIKTDPNTGIGMTIGAVHASAEQIAGAIRNAEASISALQTHLADLKQQLIIAEDAGNTELVKTLEGEIGTTNSSLSSANQLLADINGNIIASGDKGILALADATALTAEEIKAAAANATNTISQLTARLRELHTELVHAEAANNSELVAAIQTEIGKTNSELSTANSLLGDVKASVATAGGGPHPTGGATPLGGSGGGGSGGLSGQFFPYGAPGAGFPGGVPSNLPHFAEGGIMPWTGLAHLEAGEMALPPDVSAMLRRMASTPSMSVSFPNPAAGSAVGPTSVQQTNVFNVYGGSAQDNVRQIAAYMKTVSPKMAALSS